MAFTTLYLRDGRTVIADEVVPMSSAHGKAFFVHPAGQHTGAPNTWRLVWEYEFHPDHRIMVGGSCSYPACMTVRDQLGHNLLSSGFVFSL